jgi:hypothetical protein
MQKLGITMCKSSQNGQLSDCLSIVRGKPKLLDQLHQALRSRHYTSATEQTYCLGANRFIYFKNSRHPDGMTEPEIDALLMRVAAGFHTFRNSFVTHLLKSGHGIRSVH